ncbi:hypothetical protein GCM10018793_34120 [Streptomyces sulfonofaciens]|uniref:Uncharacterized protein n=1 Tax=Streptomyces sulfonofaciens TaxID=68272 RepID=A0A919G943_9ACTN|nr:hypothetical protein [Streptomyces sulfonofaciens]GHH80009.1 hypothetical protein GCM10018793_34120 [Streptomyces sulfonofaciens]
MPGMTSARRIGRAVKRSRMRRAGESAYGLLLLLRQLVLAGVVALLVAAGLWASWHPAQQAMATGGRGTLTVADCSRERCTGSYAPSAPGAAPSDHVILEQALGAHQGTKVPVARGDGDEVVRAGWAGLLRACLPLGGALLLAAVVVAGGLRLRRTARVTGLLGLALLAAAALTM